MPIQNITPDVLLTSDTKIEHISVTIKTGETLAQYAPIVFDAASGHFVGLTAGAPPAGKAGEAVTAQFLTSFAVDAKTGAVKHRAIKAVSINAELIAWPDGLAETAKAGVFAGTPISVEVPHAV